MKVATLRKGIKEELLPFLAGYGYQAVSHGFIKDEDCFSHFIHYSWLIGDGSRPTAFTFMILSKEVGVILVQPEGRDVPEFGSTLIGLTQKMVFNLRPKEFPVDTEEDIVRMCDTVKKYLINDGFEFYERHKDLRIILDQMKDVVIPKKYYGSAVSQWGLNALAIAKYLGDTDYDILLNGMRSWVETLPAGIPFTDSFDKLVRFLEHHDQDSLVELVRAQLPC